MGPYVIRSSVWCELMAPPFDGSILGSIGTMNWSKHSRLKMSRVVSDPQRSRKWQAELLESPERFGSNSCGHRNGRAGALKRRQIYRRSRSLVSSDLRNGRGRSHTACSESRAQNWLDRASCAFAKAHGRPSGKSQTRHPPEDALSWGSSTPISISSKMKICSGFLPTGQDQRYSLLAAR